MFAGAIALSAAAVSGQDFPADISARSRADDAIHKLVNANSSDVWSLLRQGADNSVRSWLIHEIPTLHVKSEVLIRRLRQESDVSAKRALILTLGGYDGRELSPSQRDSLGALLLRWYANDADPGIHGAIAWLLGPRQIDQWTPGVDWGKAASIASVDRSLTSKSTPGKRWFVTEEGQTITVLSGPLFVRMGSPGDEQGRQPASDSPPEPLHTVRIPRTIGIGTREVTKAEFTRFLRANHDVNRLHQYVGEGNRMSQVLAMFSPDDDDPAIAVTWYEAAMYCNWLSERTGLPQSEWVYPIDPRSVSAGMEMPANYLRRTGYRLPTEAEWEFAARAGTTTSRFFGTSEALLPEYAWFSRHPPRLKTDPSDPTDPQRTSPVGRLKPNDFGLFDIYGNVWEWTQDRVARHSSGDVRKDVEDVVRQVSDTDARTRRGGAFPYEAAMERSAERGTIGALPTTRRDNVGFRIARTIR
jgi:formylglycine-generating enzyme required for sulfatase activity